MNSKKISHLDTPVDRVSQDKFERKIFARSIAKEIKKADQGFNFLISGEWGTGKTSVLKMLSNSYLIGLNIKVIWFNPWKYIQTQDQSSLSRKLLIEIRKALGVRKPESGLYEGTTFERVSWDRLPQIILEHLVLGFVWFSSVALAIYFGIYILNFLRLGLQIDAKDFFQRNIFIPASAALIPILSTIITTLRIKPPVAEKIEQFEEIFKKTVDNSIYQKIIILIDDLDRSSEKDVQQLLTSIFTIFEHPKVIYVVAADYRIIEPFAGAAVTRLPDRKSDEELALKGKEYLKKIFQYIWTIPPLPPESINQEIDRLLDGYPEIINNKAGTSEVEDYASDYLKEMARKNFDNNPRRVKSFIRDLGFEMRNIKERRDALETNEESSRTPNEKQELKSRNEVARNPELLAKIIILREKFPEAYQRIKRKRQLISQLEANPGIDLAAQEEIKEEAENDTNRMSYLTKEYDNAKNFLISQKPLFKERGADPSYFIFLSGLASTEYDPDIIDTSQFINYASGGDFEKFHKSIEEAPDYKRKEYFEETMDKSNTNDPNTKTNVLRSLINSLYLLSKPGDRQEMLDKTKNGQTIKFWLKDNNGSFWNNISSQEITRWIKAVEGTEYFQEGLDESLSLSPFTNQDVTVRNRFWEAFTLDEPNLANDTLGKYGEKMADYSIDPSVTNLVLDYLSRIKDKLSATVQQNSIANKLTSLFMNLSTSLEDKIKTIEVLKALPLVDETKKQIIDGLLTLLSSTDQLQIDFSKRWIVDTTLWPADTDILKPLADSFKGYYGRLPQDQATQFNGLKQFLEGKGVWKSRVKNKTTEKL